MRQQMRCNSERDFTHILFKCLGHLPSVMLANVRRTEHLQLAICHCAGGATALPSCGGIQGVVCVGDIHRSANCSLRCIQAAERVFPQCCSLKVTKRDARQARIQPSHSRT